MMKHEFEALAGYEVSFEDYNNVIEPMYMATEMSKTDFVKCIDRKRFEVKTEYKPNIKKMLVRDRSGYSKTPNGCWYHIQYVDLIEVRISDRKFIVAPLSDKVLEELANKGTDLNYGYDYDMDYTECIDKKTRKPVTLSF